MQSFGDFPKLAVNLYGNQGCMGTTGKLPGTIELGRQGSNLAGSNALDDLAVLAFDNTAELVVVKIRRLALFFVGGGGFMNDRSLLIHEGLQRPVLSTVRSVRGRPPRRVSRPY